MQIVSRLECAIVRQLLPDPEPRQAAGTLLFAFLRRGDLSRPYVSKIKTEERAGGHENNAAPEKGHGTALFVVDEQCGWVSLSHALHTRWQRLSRAHRDGRTVMDRTQISKITFPGNYRGHRPFEQQGSIQNKEKYGLHLCRANPAGIISLVYRSDPKCTASCGLGVGKIDPSGDTHGPSPRF